MPKMPPLLSLRLFRLSPRFARSIIAFRLYPPPAAIIFDYAQA